MPLQADAPRRPVSPFSRAPPPMPSSVRLRASSLVLVALLLGGPAVPARAQEAAVPPAGPPATRRVSLAYEQARFGGGVEPWHQLTLELMRRGGAGTLLLRGTQAERFGGVGRQLELEAYPRLGPGVYGFLNLGLSPDALFPELRWGAELFTSPARGTELSAGVRRLHFASQDVTLYTGSVGGYPGNWYLSARPFVAAREEGSTVSATGLARRYFRDADEYVGVRIGAGATPAEGYTTVELERLGSWRAAAEGKLPLGRVAYARLSAGYEREEVAPGRERGRVTASVGLEKGF